MAWWRRDPYLWARSPVHRYTQRIIRDHEAALRTRCFSRTPSNTAQHQDHDGARRPDGMTDLEWSQLRRYRKWRKMLQEHPYRGLFGASEDMLRGKGLTDWEWVYKTFPKWMLQEMDPPEPVDRDKSVNKSDCGRRYGDRSEGKTQREEQPSVERKPTFAQPVIKTTHCERDEFGIVSPSDLRRPREGSHVNTVSKHEKPHVSETKETTSNRSEPPVAEQEASKLHLGQHDVAQFQSSTASIKPGDNTATAKEASNRESSFIDAFFADELKIYDRDLGNSKSWRQTALQRRSTSNAVARPKAGSFPIAKAGAPATGTTPAPVRETIMIPSSQALVDNYPYPRLAPATTGTAVEKKAQPIRKEVGWSIPGPTETVQEVGAPKSDPAIPRSTSDKLEGLPKDDIDILSADEIRAAMGTRKTGTKTSEEKKQERQKLEAGYAATKSGALDEAVEGHVLNNYYVRRTQQELERAQTASQAPEVERVEAEQNLSQPLSETVQMESSIDRMRRWIEDGSASLSNHFWKDPIEAGAPSEADMHFAKQMAGLDKGRRLREHISDDLETDLPMCKGLLERLKNDENRVEYAVYSLRSPRKLVHGAEISKDLRTIRERRLRNTYERTEKQFESACQALRELETVVVQKATNAFKRRLGIASRVLHKNHTLTRMLTWSAQARLGEPGLEHSKAELYSEILTRLATLRDTQLALARLMDHAVQTYGVSFKPADEALSRSAPNSESGGTEAINGEDLASSEKTGAKFLADTAAAGRLIDEIQSQKAAMQGLSDDGYARAPKQTPRRSFEENNPLAHSLFRPFNLQFESLGKNTKGEEAEEKLKEAFKQKMGDKKLVQEVRSAYEDVYGPITVEHRQVAPTEESVSSEARDTKAFEMLKEDPLSRTARTAYEEAKPADATAASEPPEAEAIAKEADVVSGSIVSSSMSEGVSSEPFTTAPEAVEVASETPQSTASLSTEMSSAPSTTTTDTVAEDVSTANLPTHYTILVHDPQTDTLSITTSTSKPPRDTSPALPIHQALSSLKSPAKFIPYITPGLEVVTAKRHMLILRDALDKTSSTRGFETISAQPAADTTNESFNTEVNPIDGTTRLSPTGYSGVEQSREQLERDFEERRQAAAATEAARSKKSKQQARDEEVPKKRGGISGVVKTAIWASAVCYIVGVTAEVLR
ncbi:hypothetical protein BU25DRAFT_494210 [Macroventuria anomochaeta]|uniref:Uncharacterized protein n=1 Tax=Macroventuria anomochaeta TaxID=301207 RepID=A0ACB6RQU0_9PLEO|nr:uncharacterized protein BU25DRAFT_494210 [Macroventuria anomochaeta]KAF2623770.1 hypothetical protein BU25DRAFT_494210 [Macroventuria anomochaeta]